MLPASDRRQSQAPINSSAILAGRGLGAVSGCVRAEQVLDATAQSHHVPRELARLDHAAHAQLETYAECDHVIERLVGHDLIECRPHRGIAATRERSIVFIVSSY